MAIINKLSIVILSYNTKDLLNKCLLAVTKAIGKREDIEIIVIDNASTDGSAQMVEQRYKGLPAGKAGIKIVRNKENLGFAAGNNVALKKCQSQYVLLLNPDTEISLETLEIMLNYLDKNPQVGVATCLVKLVSGKIDDACHRGFPTPWNAICHFSGLGKLFPQSVIFNGYHLGYQNLDKIHEIDACCGAFMMVRQEVGQKLNWLDEDYFWYGEDLDFCYRVKQAGWKIIFNPETSILHWKGASSGMKEESKSVTTASLKRKKVAVISSTEAMKIFYQKHYVQKYPKFVTKAVIYAIGLLARRRLSKFK